MQPYDPITASHAFFDIFRSDVPEAPPLTAIQQFDLLDDMPMGDRHLHLLTLCPYPISHAAVIDLCGGEPDHVDRLIVTTPEAYLRPSPGRIVMHPHMRVVMLAADSAYRLSWVLEGFCGKLRERIHGSTVWTAAEAATLYAHFSVLKTLMERRSAMPGDTPKERLAIVKQLCPLLIGPEGDLPRTGALLRLLLPLDAPSATDRVMVRLHEDIVAALEKAALVHGVAITVRLGLQPSDLEPVSTDDLPESAGRSALIHLLIGRSEQAERARALLKVVSAGSLEANVRVGLLEHALQTIFEVDDVPERIALLLTLAVIQHELGFEADVRTALHDAWKAIDRLPMSHRESTRTTVLYHAGRCAQHRLGRELADRAHAGIQYIHRLCALARGVVADGFSEEIYPLLDELRYHLGDVRSERQLRQAQLDFAQLLHECGWNQEAALLIRTMAPPDPRHAGLATALEATRMAGILVHGGEFEQANELARTLGNTSIGRVVRARIAEAFAERGDQEQAELLVQALEDPMMCVRILANLLIVFTKQKKTDAAARVLTLLRERAVLIQDVDDRVKTLRAAAKRLLGRGVRDGAATLAHMAADLACEDPEDINEYEFRQLGLLLARLADIDGTRRILDRVDRVDIKEEVRQCLVATLLRQGRGVDAAHQFN
jgi:hypothetical protein